MKPDFDMDDPRVKFAIESHRKQMEKALSVSQTVEDSVLPIYWTLRSETKPEQVGSGVVVTIKDEFFVFSASHVFDDIGGFQLLLGTGEGSKLASLSGERFSSKKGPSGTHSDDPIDASVFHIQSGLTEKIKSIAISLNDLDLDQPDESRSVHMAVGFRVKKSNTDGNQVKAKRECFPSIEYGIDEYSILGIDRKTHIALAYENQVLMGGSWQTSPTPKGVSGGAIVKIQGVEMLPPFSIKSNAKQLLSAITIEQRREKAGKPGVIIGTRIGVHLGLIHTYLPGLLDI
ncbi:hypothetical protein [Marinomonas atlantica]|uniref:hypothetical protein n=1 Tax=Marinomonas atlantica TaxID=1806668 RepID=UPI00082ED3C2|nr:hypothetical protein [Marinomonas atlantica]